MSKRTQAFAMCVALHACCPMGEDQCGCPDASVPDAVEEVIDEPEPDPEPDVEDVEEEEALDVPCPGAFWTCACTLDEYDHGVSLETCSAMPGMEVRFVIEGLEAFCQNLYGVPCVCGDCIER